MKQSKGLSQVEIARKPFILPFLFYSMRYILEDNSPLSTLKCNPEGIEFLKEEKTKKCFKCSNYAEMTFILTQHFKTSNRYRSVSVCKEHLTNIIKEKKDDRTVIQFPSNIN